jgi:hypothetical protein
MGGRVLFQDSQRRGGQIDLTPADVVMIGRGTE